MSNSRLLHITLPLIAIGAFMVEIYDQDGDRSCLLGMQTSQRTGSHQAMAELNRKPRRCKIQHKFCQVWIFILLYLEKLESQKSFENQASALFYTFPYIINKFQLQGISVPDNQVCQTIQSARLAQSYCLLHTYVKVENSGFRNIDKSSEKYTHERGKYTQDEICTYTQILQH